MICIECGFTEIDCLFSKFKSNYIKLTICPRCGKVVDKYIEYDNVILFIDILLLKPQAYRHLAYNVAETDLLADPTVHVTNSDCTESTFAMKFNRHKKLTRLITMTVLFEVYLVWAYEEIKPVHSPIITLVLQQKVPFQYLYFIGQVLLERFIFCTFIICLYDLTNNWFKNTNKNLNREYQRTYFIIVLLITIFISSCIKTFPIIMLIWPYDKTSISSSLINIVGILNTSEALKITTNVSFFRALVIVVFSTFIQAYLSKYLIGSTLGYYYPSLNTKAIVQYELSRIYEWKTVYEIIKNY